MKKKNKTPKRLAVASKINMRIKALRKIGIDTSSFEKEATSISGVSKTKKGNITISKTLTSEEIKKIEADISSKIPTVKQIKSKKSKIEKVKTIVPKRASEIASTYDVNKGLIMTKALKQGIGLTDSKELIIDETLVDEEDLDFIIENFPTVESFRDDVLKNSSLSEGTRESMGEEKALKKEIQSMLDLKEFDEVFKKYYDIFMSKAESGGVGRIKPEFKDKVTGELTRKVKDTGTLMQELGKIISKDGFGETYTEQRQKIIEILDLIKPNK